MGFYIFVTLFSESCFNVKVLPIEDQPARNLFCFTMSPYWLSILGLISFPCNLEIELVTLIGLCNSVVSFCCLFCRSWKFEFFFMFHCCFIFCLLKHRNTLTLCFFLRFLLQFLLIFLIRKIEKLIYLKKYQTK